MTDFKKVFVDTAPFIYFIEKDINNPQYYDRVKKFFQYGYENNRKFVSSVITLEEYYVFPYRSKKDILIEIFNRLVTTMDIDILEVDQQIAKKAAQIRAQYKGFKAMDALQLASAYISGCDLFLTNDKQLRQYEEIRCITIDELE